MPRQPRIIVAETPHHVYQRGHNRRIVFANPGDFRFYLSNLEELKAKFSVKVYTYCLMTNHVHLMLDPGTQPANLSALMKSLAARQTRYVNRLHGRTGTLWEGRFKSSPVETDAYLFACSRYIELNPVRAAMVAHPGSYKWSSYASKVGMRMERWLDHDPCYADLATEPRQRQRLYKKFVLSAIDSAELTTIRRALQRGQLTGGDVFIDKVEQQTGRRIESRGQGRPSKNKSVPFFALDES